MGVILTILGTLLLLVFLAGIGLGLYMAMNPNTRQLGWLFSLWWIPGLAAAAGVIMRDLVTFTVGTVCFLVAGVVFFLKAFSMRRAHLKRRATHSDFAKGNRGRKTAS
ncbi:hypothetical protein BH23ACT11_BH23ACT11_11540 [soil metagenome]